MAKIRLFPVIPLIKLDCALWYKEAKDFKSLSWLARKEHMNISLCFCGSFIPQDGHQKPWELPFKKMLIWLFNRGYVPSIESNFNVYVLQGWNFQVVTLEIQTTGFKQ